MTYQQAAIFATELTSRVPRWCDVRDESDELPPAPTPFAMDDCVALTGDGLLTVIDYWFNQQPMGKGIEAVCYF